MERLCTLKADLNKCKFLSENQRCNAPDNKCGMMVKVDVQEKQAPYVRQPRW